MRNHAEKPLPPAPENHLALHQSVFKSRGREEVFFYLHKIVRERQGKCRHCARRGAKTTPRAGAGRRERLAHAEGRPRASGRAAGRRCGPATRVPREPDAPKKPPSSFLLFCRAERDRVSFENPLLPMCKIACILGEMWKDLDPRKKNNYFQLAASLRKEHRLAVAQYLAQQKARSSADSRKEDGAGGTEDGQQRTQSSD
ncbi:uncharacterized protein LOC130044707 [Sorex fumeus]|uniref:uncharacterized protein LOC130044707 n=1 Tax=Sorex fumeus TaxID=62283 RepID=UPI0024ACA376|nr:uncharacterized protein LOC130044707 [Sorex fumeus]